MPATGTAQLCCTRLHARTDRLVHEKQQQQQQCEKQQQTATRLPSPALLPSLRSCWQVTLGVPWLEQEDQDKVYPKGKRYETKEDQVPMTATAVVCL